MKNSPNKQRLVGDDSLEPAHELQCAILAAGEPAMSQPLNVATLMSFAGISSVSEFARRANVSRRTVYRWMRSGLDVYKADELAVRVAHAHPACVFGHAWFNAGVAALAA